MATIEERRALLAVRCEWCQADIGEECTPPLTTLDGGCHDARWQTALRRTATVTPGSVPQPAPKSPSDANVASVRAYLEAIHA